MAVLLVQYQEEAWATSLGLCDLKIAFFYIRFFQLTECVLDPSFQDIFPLPLLKRGSSSGVDLLCGEPPCDSTGGGKRRPG